MAKPDKKPVTMQELLVSNLAQTDALAKLLIEKGLITREVYSQDFRGTGEVSEAFETNAAMNSRSPSLEEFHELVHPLASLYSYFSRRSLIVKD